LAEARHGERRLRCTGGDAERSMRCAGIRDVFRTCAQGAEAGEKCGHRRATEKQGRRSGDGLSEMRTAGEDFGQVADRVLLKACGTVRADMSGRDGMEHGRWRTPTRTPMVRGRMTGEGTAVGESWQNQATLPDFQGDRVAQLFFLLYNAVVYVICPS
jgi:hypothetical protein